MKSELPQGWMNCKFGDIAKIRSGFAFKSSWFKNKRETESDVPLIRQSQLKKSTVDLSEAVFLDRTFYERFSEFRISKDDILIGMSGAIGKVCTYTHASPSLQNQRTGKIELHAGGKIDLKFLGLFLSNIERALLEKAKGMGVQNISGKDICGLPFPMPPFNEQHRIVAKIEELFSELDKGIESLKTAQAQLKVYRQAVLKHAFEGKLTAQWREENKDKLETPEQLLARIKQEREARYERQLQEWEAAVKEWEEGGKSGKRPAKPQKPLEITEVPDALSDKLPPLPENWSWVRVGDLCEVVRGGSPRPAGNPRYYDGPIPFLKVADLTRTAGVYLDTHSFSIKEAGLRKTRFVEPPILMLSNSGATLGVPKVCRIKTTFNDGIAAFLGLDENDLLYHYYFWTSKTSELRAINQGAAQPNLNTSLIEETFIPLCSKEEMQIVAKDIGRSLSICDQLAADIDIQLVSSEALHQSILKKAFSGQLVAQDSNDEPASVLLDRIRVEREKAVKNNHPKKTKRRRTTA